MGLMTDGAAPWIIELPEAIAIEAIAKRAVA